MRLICKTQYEILFELEQTEGVCQYLYVEPSIENDTRKWIDWGLSEWVDFEPDSSYRQFQRTTYAYDVELLPRLKAYVEKSFKFICVLEDP